MALSCGELSAGIVQNCTPIAAGLEGRVILINRSDINRAKTTVDAETNTITELALQSGKIGYVAQLFDTANAASVTLNAGTYFNDWTHRVELRILDNSIAVKKFITGLQYGGVVAIVENVTKPESGDTVYEVFGFDASLRLVEATRDTSDTDIKGGWFLALASRDGANEPLVPYTLLATGGLAATETMIKTIITPAPEPEP